MITEIILIIFAICYYLFSTFLVATVIQDTKASKVKCLADFIITIIIAPIAAPIILSIEIGEWIKDN